jgi:hypothetical protein
VGWKIPSGHDRSPTRCGDVLIATRPNRSFVVAFSPRHRYFYRVPGWDEGPELDLSATKMILIKDESGDSLLGINRWNVQASTF